ncbi:MAG TPA: hypothetical protein VFR85_04835 [Anaeromyxobacteraceae bacterium]|nr:hypothetical protein [Anaeromyxobacteraceae bacterium]
MTLSVRTLLVLMAVAALCACPAEVVTGGAATEVVVQVTPGDSELEPGESLAFQAAVTGTGNTAVTWSVSEGAAGGTITAEGLYTAPADPGTYHVVATSVAETRKTSAVQVKVARVVVTISPTSANVAAGGAVAFSASVTGTSNTAVTWSVPESSGCGSVDQVGHYSAPAAAATCHVVVASAVRKQRSATAAVAVTGQAPAISVAVSPTSPVIDACQSVAFSATVTGTSNTAVTWSVLEGAAGGSITPSGLYTAPGVAGTYHVVATSSADPGSRSTVPVTVSAERVVSVQVSPSTVSVPANGSVQITATVTTTCGTFQSSKAIQGSASAAR